MEPPRTTAAPREIRRLHATDSLGALTQLLHRAYAPLAAMGLRYRATHQDVATTARRIAHGECYVMAEGTRVVGTVLLTPPAEPAAHCAWYDRPDVAVISQLAVEPDLQRQGLGKGLLNFAERRALNLGALEVSIDTAEPAVHLIELYHARGYRFICYTQWNHTNYRSVVLSKRLHAGHEG